MTQSADKKESGLFTFLQELLPLACTIVLPCAYKFIYILETEKLRLMKFYRNLAWDTELIVAAPICLSVQPNLLLKQKLLTILKRLFYWLLHTLDNLVTLWLKHFVDSMLFGSSSPRKQIKNENLIFFLLVLLFN